MDDKKIINALGGVIGAALAAFFKQNFLIGAIAIAIYLALRFLADKKDRKFVDLIMELVANLYRGNAHYSPDTAEYKITMGTFKKIEKLLSVLRVDSKKLLSGYTVSEFIEPLLYNSGLDDDNVTLEI